VNLFAHSSVRLAALSGVLVALVSGPAAADPVPPGGRADPPAPPELQGVEVTEKLGAKIPLDLTFTDETGAPIRLGSLFGDGLPVILTFNYSNCPMLCSVQLGGLVASLTKLEWSAGKEFRIVTIGLDPTEGHRRAMQSKMSYVERYDRPSADEGWRFLTGTEASIHALAGSVGFGYRKHPTRGDYLHPAALVLVSPKGVVSSYLYGIEYEADALTSRLGAAGRGSLTESIKKFLLACFHFEPEKGAAAAAMWLMRMGGLLFVCALVFAFAVRALRARARNRAGGLVRQRVLEPTSERTRT
jgi:protein SCO1